MRSYMTCVEYNETGNVVEMEKEQAGSVERVRLDAGGQRREVGRTRWPSKIGPI